MTTEAQVAVLRKALEDSLRRCSVCYGRGQYTKPCPYCDDSTYDHVCDETVIDCKRCSPMLDALAALDAAWDKGGTT